MYILCIKFCCLLWLSATHYSYVMIVAERKRLKEHGKQLLSRLDTDNCRTVTQIWAWLANQKPSVAQRNNKSNFENNSFDLVPKVSNGSGSLLNKNTQLLTKLQTKLAEMRRKCYKTQIQKCKCKNLYIILLCICENIFHK